MLKIVLGIGILSYVILILGLLHLLYPAWIFSAFIVWVLVMLFVFKNKYKNLFENVLVLKNSSRIEKIIIAIIAILSLVNLIGVFGPEISFDALWYHLTIPKIFIQNHSVFFIPGNLFYYSLMPKFSEMLFVIPLVSIGAVGAKLIEFLFCIGILIVIYQIARIYLDRKFSLLASLVFYSNLVVLWLSITSYIDITRTFYEVLAFFAFLKFSKKQKNIYLILSGILLGFAVCTKLFSLLSILIFIALIFSVSKFSFSEKIKKAIIFSFFAILIPLPWFLIAYFYTKNPFYPLFTVLGSNQYNLNLLNPLNFIKYFIDIFLFAPDPVSPIYIIVLPLIIINFKTLFKKYPLVLTYSISSFVIWYITPHDGGSRFLAPFLPVFSILVLLAINTLKNLFYKKILIGTILLISLFSIIYRGAANYKFVPVELGFETQQNFLMNNLNFSYGDFYDENEVVRKITRGQTVELIGMHNLYYVDFPFALSEWPSSMHAKYVLVQGDVYFQKVTDKLPIYQNSKTRVKLYKL